VVGVEVRVEEADCDGLDSGFAQARRQDAALGLVQRAQHGAVGQDALVELEAEAALDEGRRLAPEEVVHVRDAKPAQLEHVPEPGRGDERGRAAAPLEDGVRRDGRAVDDLGDGAAVVRCERTDGLDDRAVVARWRREQLANEHTPLAAVQDHVRERAADIDADARRRGAHSGSSNCSASRPPLRMCVRRSSS
jgi:hypothetical protein